MKKMLALLLALLMVCPMALADDYYNKEGFPICNAPITITVSGSSMNGAGNAWNDTIMVEQIEKQYGIKMDCNEFSSEAWSTQFTMMMAADTMPDLIINAELPLSTALKFAQEGYFLNLMDYIHLMPNLQAMFEQYPGYKTYCTAPDGGVYYLPTLDINEWNAYGRAWINAKWLENVGKEYPTTLDELYDVLVAFRDLDANGNGDATDEIPLTISTGANDAVNCSTDFIQDALKASFGINTRSAWYSLEADENGNVSLIETSENYKEYVAFMRKLYAEGLLDKNSFIQTGAEKRAKIADDTVGIFSAAAPYASAGADMSFDLSFDWFGMITSDANPQRTLIATDYVGKVKAMISADTKYPEAICRLIDFMLSEEGTRVAGNGWEGITWSWKEEVIGEGMTLKSVKMDDFIGDYESTEDFRKSKATINMGFVINNSFGSAMKDFLVNKATVEQLELMLPTRGWQNLMTIRILRNNDDILYLSNFPTLIYTEDEQYELATIKTDIALYTQSKFAQFVTGQTDLESGWENYVKTLETMGLKRALEIEQAAYDRMIAK